MPETRFEDIISVSPMTQRCFYIDIDPEYIHVCEENSIKPISYVPSSACICGIKVEGNKLKIEIEGQVPLEINIKLSGIRKGRRGKRFSKYNQEEAEKNLAFWDSWKE